MQTQTKETRKIRVGFDLDGVLFFNPIRFVRSPIEFVKKYVLRKDSMSFYVPKTNMEKLLWRIVHMSSLRPADGWEKIRSLTEAGLIEPYLITARFKCLSPDFQRCVKTIHADEFFSACIQNLADEQPHTFKERMVKELNIEYYIEDNWNIVSHLNQHTNAKVLWITNVLDSAIPYEARFSSLSKALTNLEEQLKMRTQQ